MWLAWILLVIAIGLVIDQTSRLMRRLKDYRQHRREVGPGGLTRGLLEEKVQRVIMLVRKFVEEYRVQLGETFLRTGQRTIVIARLPNEIWLELSYNDLDMKGFYVVGPTPGRYHHVYNGDGSDHVMGFFNFMRVVPSSLDTITMETLRETLRKTVWLHGVPIVEGEPPETSLSRLQGSDKLKEALERGISRVCQ